MRNIFAQLRYGFAQFMYGRYGMDELSRLLVYTSFFMIIVSLPIGVFGGAVRFIPYTIALFLLMCAYLRIFSRNFTKRRMENAKYLQFRARISNWLCLRQDMFRQRKEFKFFKCQSCKIFLRVPRNKGKLRIVCKKCGSAFAKNS